LLIQQHSDEECGAVAIQQGVSFFVTGDVQGAVAHALQAIDKCLTNVVMR
jgi:putative NIF3 family GTP cyclohydrolase 1 type 2